MGSDSVTKRAMVAAGGGVRRRKKRRESYSMYVYKVLKQVHPDAGISASGMRVMNSFIADAFNRISAEAVRLSKYSGKSTVTSRDIQSAVRLVLPGELAKHAASEGSKAITKYTAAA